MIDDTLLLLYTTNPAPPPSSYYYYHLLQHTTKIMQNNNNKKILVPFFSLPPTPHLFSRDTCKRCPKPEEHKPLAWSKRLKWQVYSHIELEISSGLEIAAIGLATCLKFISI